MRDARSGLRVLVVSTDQAHSTGDVLGIRVVPTGERRPTRVLADLDPGSSDASGGFLDVLALDTLALLERRWRQVAGVLAARFPESDLGDVAPEELSALPGIQEVLAKRHPHRSLALAARFYFEPQRGRERTLLEFVKHRHDILAGAKIQIAGTFAPGADSGNI